MPSMLGHIFPVFPSIRPDRHDPIRSDPFRSPILVLLSPFCPVVFSFSFSPFVPFTFRELAYRPTYLTCNMTLPNLT
jgi:hypothetical protein